MNAYRSIKMKVTYRILATALLMAICLIAPVSAQEGSEVVFLDPNLEAKVRETINKPEGAIDISTLAEKLVTLHASGECIEDLSGLEHCTSLQHLYLWWNQISDISPLTDLINLEVLGLWDNQISDISPLADLSNLKTLQLCENQISDISPLADLSNLQWLGLDGNEISDISPLSNLTNLQVLYLSNNLICDISPLSNLTHLTELYLNNDQSGISPLSKDYTAVGPYCNDNQINDISSLSGLIHLQLLDLSNNQISDIEPLVANTGLSSVEVDLRQNPLSTTSTNTYIPQLETRGVTVKYTAEDSDTLAWLWTGVAIFFTITSGSAIWLVARQKRKGQV